MYEVMMFDGGVYRINELYEMVEDMGGFILQKNQMQQMIIVTFAIPEEEHDPIDRKAEELGGKLIEVPLAGTEIAVVAPTLGRHHMPHPVCDIAEHLRRYGAITVVMGLARGKGRRTAQISTDERTLIDEYDAAVFVLGNFKDCIEKEKTKLFDEIQIPVVVACGPPLEDLPNCESLVCGIGRKAERMRRADEIAKLEEVAQAVEGVIKERRRNIEEDPLFVHPAEIKQRIESLQEIKESLRPAPIVLHQDGVRVKVPFEENRKALEEVEIYGRKLKDVTRMSESRLGRSTLIRIMTRSEIEARDAEFECTA